MSTAASRPALRLAAASAVDLAAAIDAFLSQPNLSTTTRAKYRQTLAGVKCLRIHPVSRLSPSGSNA